jgi:hypothetical protein
MQIEILLGRVLGGSEVSCVDQQMCMYPCSNLIDTDYPSRLTIFQFRILFRDAEIPRIKSLS